MIYQYWLEDGGNPPLFEMQMSCQSVYQHFIRISDFEIDTLKNNEYDFDHEKNHFILQIVLFSHFKIDYLEINEEDLCK